MKILLIAFSAIFLLLTAEPIFAHPGRTAGDGCHYCRTNCDKWGEAWNQRHCHGGGSVRSAPVYTQPVPVRQPTVYEKMIQKRTGCNRKYPGTIYRAKDDKCVCANGIQYDERRKTCPEPAPPKVAEPPRIIKRIDQKTPSAKTPERNHQRKTIRTKKTATNIITKEHKQERQVSQRSDSSKTARRVPMQDSGLQANINRQTAQSTNGESPPWLVIFGLILTFFGIRKYRKADFSKSP
jgi:hypothetical protein